MICFAYQIGKVETMLTARVGKDAVTRVLAPAAGSIN